MLIIATLASSILYNNEYDVVRATPDFSIIASMFIWIMSIVAMFIYRQMNNMLEMFPQSNNSRFVSSQLFNYIVVIWVGLTVLFMYLISFFVIMGISHIREDVRLALRFDIGFLMVGFFVFLIYAFLVVAVCVLIAAIVRKWTYYGIAVLGIFLLSLMGIGAKFITEEFNLALFFLKGIAIWLLITLASLIVNYHTVYYRDWGKISLSAILCIFIADGFRVIALPLGVTDLTPSSVGIAVSNNTNGCFTLTEWQQSKYRK